MPAAPRHRQDQENTCARVRVNFSRLVFGAEKIRHAVYKTPSSCSSRASLINSTPLFEKLLVPGAFCARCAYD